MLVVIAFVSTIAIACVMPVQWDFVLAIVWLLVASWACLDWWNDQPDSPTTRFEDLEGVESVDGLWVWFRVSLAIAGVAALIVIALLGAMLHWDWLAQRVGGVLAPAGAVVVAAIASAGAARTLLAQREIAQRERFEDAERLLWERFTKGAEQLDDSKPFAVRASAIYSLAALADDWIRHNKRRKYFGADQGSNLVTAECETILDLLCAYLRRNTHQDEGITIAARDERMLVNDAIIISIAWHAQPPDGLWAGHGLIMDLRGADLDSVNWRGVDFGGAIFKKANLSNADLSDANLAGADFREADLRRTWLKGANITPETKFQGALYDNQTRWPREEFDTPVEAVEVIDKN
jgi:hypothetical protein